MKQFETASFKMFIHDNYIKELIVKKNVNLGEKDVEESMHLSLKEFPNTRFYVLIQGEENSAVSVDARRAAASEEYAKHSVALALCSDKLHLAIAGNLFLKVNRPKVPTKFFENREKAMEWLQGLISNANHSM